MATSHPRRYNHPGFVVAYLSNSSGSTPSAASAAARCSHLSVGADERFQSTPRDYFFAPKTASFAALATRNLTTVLAGILIFCCVLGLNPVRAFLFCFASLPKPGRTNSPFFLISLYASALSVSRNTPAVLLLVSVAVASAT